MKLTDLEKSDVSILGVILAGGQARRMGGIDKVRLKIGDASILEITTKGLSFQLDKMKSNDLDFGILLNIQSDHIDYHGSFKSYKCAKEKILSAKNTITDEMDPFKLFQWITNKQPERKRE